MKKTLILIAALGIAIPAFAQNTRISEAIPGANFYVNSQVATSTTAATLVAANSKRTSCLVRNLDAAITVYIGAATVTSSTGMPLRAGESVVITGKGLWQVIAASGTPTVAVIDEYN